MYLVIFETNRYILCNYLLYAIVYIHTLNCLEFTQMIEGSVGIIVTVNFEIN